MTSDQVIRPSARKLRLHLWLQVYLPLLIGTLLLIGLAIGFWLLEVGSASVWADVGLMLIAVPAFILGLVLCALLLALIYGAFMIYAKIPEPVQKAQDAMAKVAAGSKRVARVIARPLMMPKAAVAAMQRGLSILASIFSKD